MKLPFFFLFSLLSPFPLLFSSEAGRGGRFKIRCSLVGVILPYALGYTLDGRR